MRALPSLLLEWQWESSVDDWRLEDGVVYVVGGDRLSAIDAGSGEELWDHDLERECSCSKLEILPSRVVAGIDGRAILVDRASGALAADIGLGESITALVPEPLVIGYRGPLDIEGLVLLDESSGVEIARYSPPGGVSSVERVDDWLVVKGTARGGSSVTLSGLDLSLVELWYRELPARSWTRRAGDDIVVETWAGNERAQQELDPATGDLLPRAAATGMDDGGEEIKIEMLAAGLALVLENEKPPMLIKPRERGHGDPFWQAELPVVVNASVEWRERVVLAQGSSGAPGVLLIVDTRDGQILTQAAGLRGMKELHVFGDLLVVRNARGLAAVRLDAFGPSEATSMTVEETVANILTELAGPEPSISTYSVAAELESLGAAALPYLAEAISEAGTEVVAMIARLVSESDYQPAADPLAARVASLLDEPRTESEEEWEEGFHLGQVGAALAMISTKEQVPVLDRLLELDSVDGYVRLSLMAALGRLAPERAWAALERLRAEHVTSGSWWQPPSANSWLELASLKIDQASFGDLWANGAGDEVERLAQAARTAIAESDSGRWILFPDSQFGSSDYWAAGYWAAPLEDDDSAGEAVFVGPIPSPFVDPEAAFTIPIIEARLRDRLLEVGFAGGDLLSVTLDELLLDSDGDGLTDTVETYLALDPQAADSDGDGLPDPLDSAPRGRISREISANEAALLALHETLLLVQVTGRGAVTTGEEDPRTEDFYSFLVDVPPLEWRAGPITTFLVHDSDDGTCRAVSYRLASTPPRPLEDDELALEVIPACEAWATPEWAETYMMRSTAKGWVLSDLGW